MRIRALILAGSILGFCIAVPAQSALRATDTEGRALLARSVQAMGGSLPVDVTATGQVTSYIGGSEESGTFRLMAKGDKFYREELDSSGTLRAFVVSGNSASTLAPGKTGKPSAHNTAGLRQAYYPLGKIAGYLAASDARFALGNPAAREGNELHITVSTPIAGEASADESPEFHTTEVYLDGSTFLPTRIRFNIFSPDAPNDPIPVELLFEEWKQYSGYAFPQKVTKNLNGTLHSIVRINSIEIGKGLNPQSFQIQ